MLKSKKALLQAKSHIESVNKLNENLSEITKEQVKIINRLLDDNYRLRNKVTELESM